LGIGISFNIEKKLFSLYHTFLWIKTPNDSLILRHKGSKEKFEINKVNAFWSRTVNDKMRVAMGLKVDIPNDENRLKFGFNYDVSEKLTFKYSMKTLSESSTLEIRPTFIYKISDSARISITNRVEIGIMENKKERQTTFFPFNLSMHLGDV